MRILVRHHEEGPEVRLAAHCERLLLRILGEYSQAINTVEVVLEPCAGTGGRMKCRCTLTAMMVSGGSAKASVADCADILAVYRAAERIAFCIAHRAKAGGCGKARRRSTAG